MREVKDEKRLEAKNEFLLMLFILALVLANLLGTKITTLFGIRTSVGIFIFPATFLITDIVAEVMGKEAAMRFVKLGLLAVVITLVMTMFSIWLPPNVQWGNQKEYSLIFGATLRMMVASIIAFLISQSHDVWAFHFWKRKTRGRFLWLRNNASTIVSQLIDTTVFMFIAFYKINPKFNVYFIITLIIPYWLLKVGFALLDTPFVYMGVRWMRS